MSENDTLITMSYKGEMQFIAENSTGCKIPLEPPAFMGGSSKIPNPTDYLVTALSGCIGIKTIMDISGKGFKLDSFSMKIDGTRSKSPSRIFEKLHFIVTLSGDVDDLTVAEIIEDAVMHTCPVAAMFRETMEITWEHQIIE
jgi:putative redox protein